MCDLLPNSIVFQKRLYKILQPVLDHCTAKSLQRHMKSLKRQQNEETQRVSEKQRKAKRGKTSVKIASWRQLAQ